MLTETQHVVPRQRHSEPPANQVAEWRRRWRRMLMVRRQSLIPDWRHQLEIIAVGHIEDILEDLPPGPVAFYWPVNGEVDMRYPAAKIRALGRITALPVVVGKEAPLEFWRWETDEDVAPGVWDIPIPSRRRIVAPAVAFVPLLGFDRDGHRLGYGAGYYDRTFASLHPRPLLIGVGFEVGRLDSIHPQPHDIPMDVIVTEAGVHCASRKRENER